MGLRFNARHTLGANGRAFAHLHTLSGPKCLREMLETHPERLVLMHTVSVSRSAK